MIDKTKLHEIIIRWGEQWGLETSVEMGADLAERIWNAACDSFLILKTP